MKPLTKCQRDVVEDLRRAWIERIPGEVAAGSASIAPADELANWLEWKRQEAEFAANASAEELVATFWTAASTVLDLAGIPYDPEG